jgi:hypothetical protein
MFLLCVRRKLENPIPTPFTLVQWHDGNNLKTTTEYFVDMLATEYFVDMLADMVSPIVKSTGVQAPTILRPSSFQSNKVLFEYGLLSMLPPHFNNIQGRRNHSAKKPNGMHDCVSHFQCADNLPTSMQLRVTLSATSDDSSISAALYHHQSLYFTPRLPTCCAPTTKVKYICILGGRLICKWLRRSKLTHQARDMRIAVNFSPLFFMMANHQPSNKN